MSKEQTRFLMVQGTMSNVGKSLITAGLCRIFYRDGYRVAPFKSQNMALNSYVTKDGLEMGRAQVLQAQAACVEPDVSMNPILLKPTSNIGSQVIVNGKVLQNMDARSYFAYKKNLVPVILEAVEKLKEQSEIIVIEGAGSPAEINLKENDIVNMGMAELVDAPVLLVGDIDRGGVFAQLLGTIELLTEAERARVKGLIINRFRGDVTLLEGGIVELEKRCGMPVLGVLPYMDLSLDDEDSLAERFNKKSEGKINVCIIKFPHISNFTDFNGLDEMEDVGIRWVKKPPELKDADLIILPGSKNTIDDLLWLKENGLAEEIRRLAGNGCPVLGICGGYQMLGRTVEDPEGVESGRNCEGLKLLSVTTVLKKQKTRRQVRDRFEDATGIFAGLRNTVYSGYEIHMGETVPDGDGGLHAFSAKGSGYCQDNIYGTYVHGLLDESGVLGMILRSLARRKGLASDITQIRDHFARQDEELDRLADMMRLNLNMQKIYKILG